MVQLWLHTGYISIKHVTDQDRKTKLILCDIQKFLFEEQLYISMVMIYQESNIFM